MKQFFTGCRTAEEAKKRYRELCREWHPDVSSHPDATEVMKAINAE